MPVPETSVNEDSDTVLGKVEIRRAGEIRLNFVSDTESFEKGGKSQLRSSACATDGLHYPTPRLAREHVCHLCESIQQWQM